ncbi:hypothetical protein HYS31_06480 [Candidatus Woesearchaeota archaeon]|nr:hypothetical protein [Candidatus Woesearchaeota archaeon]
MTYLNELINKQTEFQEEIEKVAKKLYEKVIQKGTHIDKGRVSRVLVEDNNFYIANTNSGCMGCPDSPLVDIVEASQIAGPYLALNGKELFLLDKCTASDMSRIRSNTVQQLPAEAKRGEDDISYYLIEIARMYSPAAIHYFGRLGSQEDKPITAHFKIK